MSDPNKIGDNEKEMLKLIAPMTGKSPQTTKP